MDSNNQKSFIPVNRPWAGNNNVVQQGPSPIAPTGSPMLDVFLAQPIQHDPFNTIDAFLPFDTRNSALLTADYTGATLSSTAATHGISRWLIDDTVDSVGSSELVGTNGHVDDYQESQEVHGPDFLVGMGGAFSETTAGDVTALQAARVDLADFMEDINLILSMDPETMEG